ncbi:MULTISPECIES: XRE family transcriptional regulator [unclassified Pseudovibrio]|uniref:XRE family transcriptional regulator n=1 Tax=unclassified Pseudovibrio TaxID=2627060 RepID=UPI0007AE515F|nr:MULTISPECIES: XRE family transcriptional regulator [unclassified Pseudovibrio]KZK85738.1 Helix-turn-helix domain protein [Pseudovibrio sp. Ad46]KZL10679.1 Helix-turn-helix domain protein [Pseudovibrio sp. Ad26]
MTQELKDRLKSAREKAGFSSAADAAEALGIKTPTYTHHENGTRKPKSNAIERYARFFGVDATWLFFGKGEGARAQQESRPLIDKQRVKSLLQPFTVPVFGSLSGGNEDYLEATGEYLDHIPAPRSLMDVAGAYALYMPGNTMEPRYLEGEALFVNPKKLPRAGEYAAIQHVKDTGAEEHLVIQVGRYEGIEKGKRVFSRHNGENLKIPAEKMRAMQKVIATGEW